MTIIGYAQESSSKWIEGSSDRKEREILEKKWILHSWSPPCKLDRHWASITILSINMISRTQAMEKVVEMRFEQRSEIGLKHNYDKH